MCHSRLAAANSTAVFARPSKSCLYMFSVHPDGWPGHGRAERRQQGGEPACQGLQHAAQRPVHRHDCRHHWYVRTVRLVAIYMQYGTGWFASVRLLL
jgi:hypothetical protein